MRVSHDKLDKLAHVIADTLAETDECEFHEDRNTIARNRAKCWKSCLPRNEDRSGRAPEGLLPQENIPEGSQEWEILYRKYYQEEVKKLGL